MIYNKKSPIIDAEIEDYLANRDLSLEATTDNYKAYKNAEWVCRSYTVHIPGVLSL
jgi:UDPglucose 6-dehydrogenase